LVQHWNLPFVIWCGVLNNIAPNHHIPPLCLDIFKIQYYVHVGTIWVKGLKHKTFTNSKGLWSLLHMEGCYKDLGNHKKERVLGHKHFRIPRNCCHRIIFFAFQKLNKICTPNLRIILWTLGRFEKLGTWKLTQLLKKINKRWRFLCDEYIWTKIIHVTKYEKWKKYFKSEATGDFLSEISAEEWKWYKKG
jgi:hypothetical protein